MSLLNSYGSDNLVIDSGLVVTYSKSLVSGGWGYTSANVSGSHDYMWELHRRARQSFRYVGMTYDAAQTCKTAMIAKYTRSFKMSLWDGSSMGGSWTDNPAGSMPMAEISVAHNEDGSYDVLVNVNEDDMRMRKVDGDVSPSVPFYTEASRSYEGGESE